MPPGVSPTRPSTVGDRSLIQPHDGLKPSKKSEPVQTSSLHGADVRLETQRRIVGFGLFGGSQIEGCSRSFLNRAHSK